MPHASLAEFLEELARRGELARVAVEVEARAELPEIARRLLERSGPAVLFAKVKGSRLPVVANLLANERRICLALDAASLDEIANRLSEPLAGATSGGWMDALRLFPATASGQRFQPRQIKNAPAQQVVRLASDVDLTELPIPSDTGARGAAAVVVAQSYDRGENVMEMCRLTLAQQNRIHLAWQPTGSLHRAARDHQRRDQPLPLAILLGAHPLDCVAALAPQPMAGDPWLLAGLLRGRALEVARLRSVELEAPADAELLLEGVIDTRQPLAAAAAEVEIAAITHRVNPVLVSLLGDAPPHELSLVTAAVQRMFLPRFKQLLPELIDFAFPPLAGGRLAIVSIQKAFAGQFHRVTNLLWGLGTWPEVRLLIVVDEDVDVHDAFLPSRLLASADFERDVQLYQGPASVLQPASHAAALDARWALDATSPWPGEPIGQRGDLAKVDPATAALVQRRWSEYGLPAAE